jgi:hypothetical protein
MSDVTPHLVSVGAGASETGDLIEDGHEQVSGVVGHLALWMQAQIRAQHQTQHLLKT